MGEDCGVLRRKNVDMGVLATKPGSSVNFSGRRPVDRLSVDDRRVTLRSGDIERGEDESACSARQDVNVRKHGETDRR